MEVLSKDIDNNYRTSVITKQLVCLVHSQHSAIGAVTVVGVGSMVGDIYDLIRFRRSVGRCRVIISEYCGSVLIYDLSVKAGKSVCRSFSRFYKRTVKNDDSRACIFLKAKGVQICISALVYVEKSALGHIRHRQYSASIFDHELAARNNIDPARSLFLVFFVACCFGSLYNIYFIEYVLACDSKGAALVYHEHTVLRTVSICFA